MLVSSRRTEVQIPPLKLSSLTDRRHICCIVLQTICVKKYFKIIFLDETQSNNIIDNLDKYQE